VRGLACIDIAQIGVRARDSHQQTNDQSPFAVQIGKWGTNVAKTGSESPNSRSPNSRGIALKPALAGKQFAYPLRGFCDTACYLADPQNDEWLFLGWSCGLVPDLYHLKLKTFYD
jgi:hypothetical protein